MGNKIIEILQMPKTEESISLLCNLCHIESYQASKIIDEFQKAVDSLYIKRNVDVYNN